MNMNKKDKDPEIPGEEGLDDTDACAVPPVDEDTKATKKKAPKKEKKLTELEKVQAQAEEYLNGWKRAQADYQNLQKETETRLKEVQKFATESLLLQLIPIVDHFKYAFKGIPEEERSSNWIVGVEHIQTNFLRILEEHGIEVIESVGKEFDTDLHEAVEEVEGAEGQKSGTVAEEMTTGFKMNGKVMQCAKVKVIK